MLIKQKRIYFFLVVIFNSNYSVWFYLISVAFENLTISTKVKFDHKKIEIHKKL